MSKDFPWIKCYDYPEDTVPLAKSATRRGASHSFKMFTSDDGLVLPSDRQILAIRSHRKSSHLASWGDISNQIL